jgi:glycosyltransferase involved in cell wall biosynthesis
LINQLKYKSITILLPIRIDQSTFIEYFTNLSFCLEAVSRADYSNYKREVIVVDWGSTEEYAKKIKDLVKSYKYAYMFSPASFWSRAHAFNFAIPRISGERTLVIDADTVIPRTYIMDHLKQATNSNYTLSFVFNSHVTVAEKSSDTNALMQKPGRVRTSGRSHVSMPSKWLKVNGYNKEYIGWGGEDDDLIVRMRLGGLHEVIVNSTPVHLYHPHYGDAMESISKDRGDWFEENRLANKKRFRNFRLANKQRYK